MLVAERRATGAGAPTGLATLLSGCALDRDGAVLTSLHTRLDGLAAVEYFVSGQPAAAARCNAPPLLHGAHIDFQAVQQRVHAALQAAAGQDTAAQPAEEGQAAGAAPKAAPPLADGNEDAGGASGSTDGSVSPAASRHARYDGSSLHSDSEPASPQAPAPDTASTGRLGPAEVTLVAARGSCNIRGCSVLSKTNFSTLRSSVCVFKGRWMYEVQLGSAGIMQLGWTTLQARFNSEEGVGDNQDSYAYDGRRMMRWHVSNAAYGERWTAGDVISCCLDLDAGTMHFARNGKDLGEAFSNVRCGMPGMAYFAGLSLSYSERCEVNFGARPFLHPVEGYQPLQQQLAQPVPLLQHVQPYASAVEERRAQMAAARYLARCLTRLLDVSSPPAAHAGAGAAAADWRAGGPASGAAGQQSSSEAGSSEAEQEEGVAAALAGTPAPAHSAPGVAARLLPDADMLAALAAAAGESGSSKGSGAEACPLHDATPAGRAVSGPAIDADDRVLLGAVLAQYLGPLCFDPYIVEGVLLEALDDAAGELTCGSTRGGGADGGGDAEAPPPADAGPADAAPARPAPPPGGACGTEHGRQRLRQLLELLAAVLEPEELSALVTTCGQVLARRVRGSVWSLADMPSSPALAALRLWSAMLDCPVVMEAWLASGDWRQQLEDMLVLRQPTEAGLAELMRNLKVEWDDGGGAVVPNRQADQSLFACDLGWLTLGLEQVEAAQADILLQLWLQPPGDETDDAQQQRNEPAAAGAPPLGPGRHLREFLRDLADRNRGAAMHLPPPGLSDQTALVSAVFALLRLMNEQVSAVLPTVPTLRWDPAANFLQGGALGVGSDPYYDTGRLGGLPSHLAREHPPTEEERRPLEGLKLGAVVEYEAPLRLRDRVRQGPSFSDAWLRDRLLVLCHLSAAPLMRGALNHMASMQAAMAGLRAVSASVEEGGSTPMLEQTQRECQQEFERSLRQHEWVQCWLLSPGRQQAAFTLSVATVQLVAAVSCQRGGLLRYVPELYLTAVLDMVHAIHQCEPAALDHSSMLGLGLRHIVEFVVAHLQDGRVSSPEVQSRLAQMVLEGVQELQLLRELGSNGVARHHLLPAMMRLFGQPNLWGQASNFFALLVEGCGFLHPPPPFPPEVFEAVGTLRAQFKQACMKDPELCAAFLNHLFDHTNRMLTELVASLESVDRAWSRQGGGAPSTQLLRLLASTADYTLILLRTLELMAAEMPQLFLDGSELNLVRLAEVVGFAAPQFVNGSAHHVLQRLISSRRLAQQLRLRSAHLLQPLAGLLIALSGEEEDATGGSGSAGTAGQAGGSGPGAGSAVQGTAAEQHRQQPPAHRHSLLRALNRQAALTDGVLKGLLAAELAHAAPLALEAEAAAADDSEPPAEQRCRYERDVRRLGRVVSDMLAARQAASSGGGSSDGQEEAAGEAGDVPEEFLDPILATLMQDPVLLPDSRVTLDRATIERHLLSSATDPFSRAPLTAAQLTPNTELRRQIEEWQQQHLRLSQRHQS